jgi:hypothetical protein
MSRAASISGDTLAEEQGPMLSIPHEERDVELQTFISHEDPHGIHTPTRLTMRFEGMLGRAKTLRKKQQAVWERFNGVGRRRIGVVESLQNIATSSCKCLFF